MGHRPQEESLCLVCNTVMLSCSFSGPVQDADLTPAAPPLHRGIRAATAPMLVGSFLSTRASGTESDACRSQSVRSEDSSHICSCMKPVTNRPPEASSLTYRSLFQLPNSEAQEERSGVGDNPPLESSFGDAGANLSPNSGHNLTTLLSRGRRSLGSRAHLSSASFPSLATKCSHTRKGLQVRVQKHVRPIEKADTRPFRKAAAEGGDSFPSRLRILQASTVEPAKSTWAERPPL